MIDDHHVVTALHVVWCARLPEIRVYLSDGRSRAMAVRREDRAGDLALLATASAEPIGAGPPSAIGPPIPIGGSACAATATPARTWACGTVTNRYTGGQSGDTRYTADTRHGNSGSGVYDASGRLVGIVIALHSAGGGYFTTLADHEGVLP